MAKDRIAIARTEASAPIAGYRAASDAIGPSLTIRFSAFLWFNVFMALMCGVPVGGVLAAFVGSVSPLGFFFVCAAIVYALTAVVFNRVEVRVWDGRITSRLTPLPFWPQKSIPTKGITHVVATQSILTPISSESTNVSWYVVALVGDEQRPITRHLRTRDEAVLVAQTLEEHLGLEGGRAYDDPS